jgi:uncharacterized protein DUF4388
MSRSVRIVPRTIETNFSPRESDMLQGSLDVFALPDVLRLVSQSGATGLLAISRKGAVGALGLHDGAIVGAELSGVNANDVETLLDAALTMVDASGGQFELVQGTPTEVGRYTVEEFLDAIGEHRARWQAIVGELGGLDQPVALNPNLPDEDSTVTLSAHEWKLAVLADGSRTVGDLAGEAGLSVLRTATTLVEMQRSGLLEGVAAAAPAAPPPPPARPARSRAPKRAPSPELEADDEVEAVDEDETGEAGSLLRELGADEAGGRRPPTREEQRLRLRRW